MFFFTFILSLVSQRILFLVPLSIENGFRIERGDHSRRNRVGFPEIQSPIETRKHCERVFSRLFVTYEKAKEYLAKISAGIDKHIDFWHARRPIIAEQARSASMDFLLPKTQRMNELIIEAVQSKVFPTKMFRHSNGRFAADLCRVDLLIEQVVRLEPKLPPAHQTRPMTSSFSSRSMDPIASPSINVPRFPAASASTVPKFSQPVPAASSPSPRMMTQPVLPVPVIKRPASVAQVPPPTLSGRVSTTAGATGDVGLFKPIDQQSPYPSYQERPPTRTSSYASAGI